MSHLNLTLRVYQILPIVRSLNRLAKHPWMLCGCLFFLNSLLLPYYGIHHDAILYAFQTMNKAEHGIYSHDIFLKYGSQDRFSLFSSLTAPLAILLGIPLSFWLCYLITKVLFFISVVRLILLIVKPRYLATMGSILVAIDPIYYGGLHVFSVNESFFTPRLIAQVTVLCTLERWFIGKTLQAWMFAFVGMLFHPLMNFVAIVFLSTSAIIQSYQWKGLLTLVGILTCVSLILHFEKNIALQFLGHLDDEWYNSILQSTHFNLPDHWYASDWARLVIESTVIFLAISTNKNPRTRLLLGLIFGLGCLGVLLSLIAAQLAYALPVKVQFYRWEWPLALFAVLHGPKVVIILLRSNQLAWQLLSTVFIMLWSISWDFRTTIIQLLVQLTLPLSLSAWLILTNRTWENLFFLLISFTTITNLLNDATIIITAYQDAHSLQNHFTYITLALIIIHLLSPSFRFFPSMFLIRWFSHSEIAKVLALVLISIASFSWMVIPEWILGVRTQHRVDSDFDHLIAWIETNRNPNHPQTVFVPNSYPGTIWFEMKLCSYFSIPQGMGNLFHRENAIEFDRRLRLTRAFQFDPALSRLPPNDREKRIFALSSENEALTPLESDLLQLCRDPELDWVIIPRNFPKFEPIAFGKWYLYDAHRIRSQYLHM